MGDGHLRAGTGTLVRAEPERDAGSPRPDDDARRRFTVAALIALGVSALLYLWVLWDRRFDPLRTAWPNGRLSEFYDLQARALFDGHWHLPEGSLGIEAFVIDGKHYMYQGPFPALLRMPLMLVTDSFDGELTALSMLLAWAVTGLFTTLLLWRVRILLRGPAPLSRGEAVSMAVFIATVMSGSVLLYLATMPWVFHEAFAWGVAFTIGALFALLGVLEHPSGGRVAATAALTAGALLSRNTVGWGCVIGAALVAVWFATGRGGNEQRRWWLPVLVAGALPLAVACAVNFIKFDTLFGIPMHAQVFTEINAHRREVLADHGGSLWSFGFIPSTVWTYFRPNGLRLTSVFPFITLPSTAAKGVGGAVFDQTYRTGSAPTTMPLLFVLGIWGAVTAFRPRAFGRIGLARIPLLAAAAGTGGVFLWGYMAHRYLGDLMPLLVLAGAVGLVDVWRRVEGRVRPSRIVLAAVGVLGVWGVIASLAVASTPTDRIAWEGGRVRGYVETQDSLADLTGRSLDVTRGEQLPDGAPADALFVVGDCRGLYISTGETFLPWIPVEVQQAAVDISFNDANPGRARVPLMTIGEAPYSATLSVEGDGDGRVRFRVGGSHNFQEFYGRASPPNPGPWQRVEPDRTYRVVAGADSADDPPLLEFEVLMDDRTVLEWATWAPGQDVVTPRPPREASASEPVTIVESRVPEPTLCRDVIE